MRKYLCKIPKLLPMTASKTPRNATCTVFSRFSAFEFFLFPRLKRALKDHSHAYIQAFQTAMRKDLCKIPKLLPRTASKTPRNAGSGL
jgi:hypothetical protein